MLNNRILEDRTVKPEEKAIDLSQCRVFFDFDGTITEFDVLDDIIRRFCATDDWIVWERDWAAGKISSHKCLREQLRSVRASKETLATYLSEIRVDRDFYRLLALLRKKGVKPVIISDSFSFFIKTILDHNGIKGIRVYANGLKFFKDRLRPFFPHFKVECPKCANCKKTHLDDNADGKTTIYIGDGHSDMCAAEHADLVFAKGTLLKHMKEKKLSCFEFCNLGDIYQHFKEVNRGTEK